MLDYLRLFIFDVYQNPNEANKDSIQNLLVHLNEEGKFFLGSTIIMSYIELQPFSIVDAIGRQRSWNDLPHANLSKILNDSFTCELILENILQKALKAADQDLNWQNYLYIVNVACETYKTCHIRDFLNSCFRDGVSSKNHITIYTMFLTARECVHSMSFSSYSNWYKAFIGEMTYRIDKEGFKFVMKVLTRMVEYETDTKVLKVHHKIGIQAPAMCKELISLYKTVIKSKLDSLNDANSDDVVVID